MKKTLILDTSALIAGGGKILTRLKNVDIIVPTVVLEDVNAQLKNPTLTASAASVFNTLEQLRDKDSSTSEMMSKNGTTFTVEPNHAFSSDAAVRAKISNMEPRYQRLINIYIELKDKAPHAEIELVTQDNLLRVLASSVFNIEVSYVDQYINRADIVYVPDTKIYIMNRTELIDALYSHARGESNTETTNNLDELKKTLELKLVTGTDHVVPANNVFQIVSENSNTGKNALTLAHYDRVSKKIKAVSKGEETVGITAKSFEQQAALHYLNDKDIPVVSISGAPGTGKTFLALASALGQLALKEGSVGYNKITVFRPLYAVERQELGYLPGSEKEKMDPWAAAIHDAMDAISPASRGYYKDLVEVIPVTHIRGRTFNNRFVIVDEAQNLEYSTLLTILSRMGEGTKTALLWDVAQRDNMKIDSQGGIQALYQKMVTNSMFAHTTLVKNERSPMAQFAGKLLEEMM